MHKITTNIGSANSMPKKGEFQIDTIKEVLVIRPNHRLGNQLLLTPIVQEVINTFPNSEVDLFVKGGVAFPVFKNYKGVNRIISLPKKPFSNLFKYIKVWLSIKNKRYDLVINADKNSSSGRLLTQLSKSKFKIFGEAYQQIENDYLDYKHISKYPIYNLRYYLSNIDISGNDKKVPVLDIKLSHDEVLKGKMILDKIIKNDKKTICIYTNATGNKCYSEAWWTTFYNRLIVTYPNFNIIEMLPIENISKINFKSLNFYSKDIREMAAIIKNTAIFIAADNGVMHLASASLTPTVGFFSVTNENAYAPYGNGSFAINTNKTDINDWFKKMDSILS